MRPAKLYGFGQMFPGNTCGLTAAAARGHTVLGDLSAVFLFDLYLQGKRPSADAAGWGLGRQYDLLNMLSVKANVICECDAGAVV